MNTTSDLSRKRIIVDFNTMLSEPVGVVKVAKPGSLKAQGLPPLASGERVTLYDHDGLEVEAQVWLDADGWWLATPDDATWHDAIPEPSDTTDGR